MVSRFPQKRNDSSGPLGQLARIASRLAEHGLTPRGGVLADTFDRDGGHDLLPDGSGRRAMTILLVGVEGQSLWPHLERDARFQAGRAAGATNALDAWSERTLRGIAEQFSAAAVFPNDQPYRPFQRWALRSGTVFQSPIGMLIHSEFGLWHAYRGALLFEDKLDLPPYPETRSPCETCTDKPCLSACPVGAFTETDDPATRYNVAACAEYLKSTAGKICLTGGCQARNACPVGANHRYAPDQMGFHMAAFARARGVDTGSSVD